MDGSTELSRRGFYHRRRTQLAIHTWPVANPGNVFRYSSRHPAMTYARSTPICNERSRFFHATHVQTIHFQAINYQRSLTNTPIVFTATVLASRGFACLINSPDTSATASCRTGGRVFVIERQIVLWLSIEECTTVRSPSNSVSAILPTQCHLCLFGPVRIARGYQKGKND